MKMRLPTCLPRRWIPLLTLAALLVLTACSQHTTRMMEVTAYCRSGKDNGYERGSWKYLKLDQWNRYVNYGSRKGEIYTGLTASGTRLRQYDPGLLHPTTLTRPWNLPHRLARLRHLLLTYDEPGPPYKVQHGLLSLDTATQPARIFPRLAMTPVRLFIIPGLLRPRLGTIAADTDYYPFGTVMHIPGYGTGIVEDRGGAIKGPDRLDLFYFWNASANQWGRQQVRVKIQDP